MQTKCMSCFPGYVLLFLIHKNSHPYRWLLPKNTCIKITKYLPTTFYATEYDASPLTRNTYTGVLYIDAAVLTSSMEEMLRFTLMVCAGLRPCAGPWVLVNQVSNAVKRLSKPVAEFAFWMEATGSSRSILSLFVPGTTKAVRAVYPSGGVIDGPMIARDVIAIFLKLV